MKIYAYLFLSFLFILFIYSCQVRRHTYLLEVAKDQHPVYKVMATPSYEEGNAEKGFHYMIYGDYVGNGIPSDLFKRFFGEVKDTVLNREGDNALIPYSFTGFESFYGEKVVNGNCFTCHAAPLDGKIVLGLGNSFDNFQPSKYTSTKILNWLVKQKFGKNSPEWNAYREHGVWLKEVAWATKLNNPGINPALRIEEATLAYREPEDLSFKKEPNFKIPRYAFGADVPALWSLQKKGALYYNGMGRGDFTKLLMQACLLGIHDSTSARVVQQNFKDVIAWIMELEPPKYPYSINQDLAAKGKLIFENNCSKCHGTYGKNEFYPNKIVHLDEVKTDPYYALYALQSPANGWYNKSWFSQTSPKAYSKPSYGYMAPPLDGVWATAPYLHNGSVPTIAALLDSKKRPTFWQFAGPESEYDYEEIGRKFIIKSNKSGKRTYNTLLPGSGNQGHTFGDSLSVADRRAVMEYLKTL